MNELKLNEIMSFDYKRSELDKGYTGKILDICLGPYLNSIGEFKLDEIYPGMKEKFIGGKGFALKLLWDSVHGIEHKDGPSRWSSPENALCIAHGPLGGTVYPGSGKSIVTTISPLTGIPIDSNVGGYFGPFLKFAGFDALRVSGMGKKSESLIILIDGIEEKIKLYNSENFSDYSHELSSQLTNLFDHENPQNISVISTGLGAKYNRFGCINSSWFDVPRKIVRYKQAGRGGCGTVLAYKKLKAIVVRWHANKTNINNPCDPEKLKDTAKKHIREIKELDPKQNEMAVLGTTHLVTIMNDFKCLPVNNFQYSNHPEAEKLGAEIYRRKFDPGFDGCWKGCPVACAHGVKNFVPKTGPYKGQAVFVDGPEYETIGALGTNLGIFDPDFVIEANFYCDIYGLDTISTGVAMAFAMECYEKKIIGIAQTCGLHLKFGNAEAALNLLHYMAEERRFGLFVGQGIKMMKKNFTFIHPQKKEMIDSIGMESKGLEFSLYISRDSLAQQGGYGLTLKGAQHDEAWLIFLDKVHNRMPTFEQKAYNLWWFPMWRTWFSLMGLCKLPWNDIVPTDNNQTKEPAQVIKHVKWYRDYFNAMTGANADIDDLLKMSERIYNFQRIFNLRMGYGKREDDYLPYRAIGETINAEEYINGNHHEELLNILDELDISSKLDISKKFCQKTKKHIPQNKEETNIFFERYKKQILEILNIEEKIDLLKKIKKQRYETLKTAVYKQRGWRQDGVPSMKTIKKLGLNSVPGVIETIILDKNK